jgi:MATE family multidrug resistance protein
VRLLTVGAVFQLFDGVQAVATGALRGLGDTRTAMIWNLAGHWFVGLPLGYVLCFGVGVGVVGLWWGLTSGLVICGISLLIAWSRRMAAAPGLLSRADRRHPRMADETRGLNDTSTPQEENAGQRQSDATPDLVGGREISPTEMSDRADGRGSDANGTPAFDEVEGEQRRKLYEKGATLVSKID